MKSATAALETHLATTRFFRIADLISIVLPSGETFRYCNLDLTVTADGYTWVGGSPLFRRTGTRRVIGIEVSTMTITGAARPEDLLGSVPWSDVVRLGTLDGADVVVRRGYFTDYLAPAVGSLWVFEGRVGDVEGGVPEITIPVRSIVEQFNAQTPRSLYQAGCRNRLFDTATCKVSRPAFEVSGNVSSADRVKLVTTLAKPDGWAGNGQIRMTSGAATGQSRDIKSQLGGTVIVAEPFTVPPAAGDGFIVSAGCDGALATCRDKFSNIVNFRGEPFVPTPETAL